MTAENRQWVLRSRPRGPATAEHFEWRTTPRPAVGEGEFLVRNLYLSCDPAQRPWMEMDTYIPMLPLGEVMLSGAAGEVVESNHPGFARGELVSGVFGWQDYAVSDGGSGVFPVTKIPPGIDPPTALSLFGVTGLTAHIGLLDIGRPEPGDTVVVSGAAGSVGSFVVQIARLEGLRVVAIAGGPAKCAWLEQELGADAVIDYKNEDVGARLAEVAPDGVDVFFDNVGGEILDAVLDRITIGARIVLCGAISGYNDFDHRPAIRNHYRLIIRRATMRGFLVFDHAERVPQAISDLAAWAAEGRIKAEIDVVDGLEHAPDALNRLFDGRNRGKQLVRVA
jgi:NADPH-dependent curcumin reductase CurA